METSFKRKTTMYAFVEKDMYDAEECDIHVFNSEKEAIEKMNQVVNVEIGLFVRDMGYAPYVTENKEKNQITMIHCHPEDYITLSGDSEEEIPRTDFRVVKATVHL